MLRERGGFGGGLGAGDGQKPGGADGSRHHGGANDGRNQGGALTEGLGGTQGLTDGVRTRVYGVSGRAEKPMDQGDIHSLEAQSRAAGSRDRGGDGGSADQGNDGVSEDDREAGGKKKPSGAEGGGGSMCIGRQSDY